MVVVEVAPFEEEGEDLADIERNIFSSTVVPKYMIIHSSRILPCSVTAHCMCIIFTGCRAWACDFLCEHSSLSTINVRTSHEYFNAACSNVHCVFLSLS